MKFHGKRVSPTLPSVCGVARGNTPLHLAAGEGATEVVKLLLAANAPLEVENKDGRRPQPGYDQFGSFFGT